MDEALTRQLTVVTGDQILVDTLWSSYARLTAAYMRGDAVGVVQDLGRFVESSIRFAQHLVLRRHTPVTSDLDLRKAVEELEKASGNAVTRIHLPRLCRAIYDFRTRKNAVHLKGIDPDLVDARLLYEVCTWMAIELLEAANVPGAEDTIKLLHSRKLPLVEKVHGILRTTDPHLTGPQRILLLLYSSPNGLSEQELLEGTSQRIKTRSHLRTNLRDLCSRDLVHEAQPGMWVLFGRGAEDAERLISRAAKEGYGRSSAKLPG